MKKKLNIKPKRESNIPERNMMQDSVRMPKAGYGGTTGMGTVPMMMFEHGGKFGSYDNRDTGYYKQGGYIWQTTPHMKHGGMPAYGQSFPEANWWGYRSSGPSQFTLPYQLDIKLPPPPEREGPIPTYRNEINSTDYDAAMFKAGGRVRMKFRGENHEIYQDGDAVYVNHPDTKPGKDKSKWKKFNATKEVGAKTIGQAEHAIEEWHNANPGKYEFGGNVTTGQWAILDDDENDLPEAGSGYKVVRSSERKGKTHKVTGPDGTVKFFGDSKLGQHPKDPARKKAFYARHKKNLAGNPYFRAFARKTWAEGGELNDWEIMQEGGDLFQVENKNYPTSFRELENKMMRTPQNLSYSLADRILRGANISLGGGHNDNKDALRHSGTAMYSTSAQGPLLAPFKIPYTNLLGLAHEAKGFVDTYSNPNRKKTWTDFKQDLKETGSDLYNNFIGSTIGGLPISLDTKEKLLKKAHNNNLLSILEPSLSPEKQEQKTFFKRKEMEKSFNEMEKSFNEEELRNAQNSALRNKFKQVQTPPELKRGGKIKVKSNDWEIVSNNEWEII